MISEVAPAKINLSLRVLGRRADGYHKLQSVVVFTDIGDHLSFEPGDAFELQISGPFASAIEGVNLIEHASRSITAVEPRIITGRFRLEKLLPVAAGIGGGSANAAAALRLMRAANPEFASTIDWMGCAGSIGADVPVCFLRRPAIMEGIGERVRPVDIASGLSLLLVNSGAQLSTAEIFKRFDAASLAGSDADGESPLVPDLADLDSLLAYMDAAGNDLEEPAAVLCPEIRAIKKKLLGLEGCLYSALSGSGPTCFGIFTSHESALEAEGLMRADQPEWWIRAARII